VTLIERADQFGLPENFTEWIARQRWFGKGATPVLDHVGGWATGSDDIRITTHYLRDTASASNTLYQVPLVERSEPLTDAEPIGRHGDRFVYDAPHDPAFATAIIDLIFGLSSASGSLGKPQPGATRPSIETATVLRGEQSNTSIICQVHDGVPVMLKIFRALHDGENPDVVLQSAIAAAGSQLVPVSIGSLSGTWPDPGRSGGTAQGHLAFAQEFLPGAEDAWRVALRAAETGDDFTESATTLGAATAEVHETLRLALPTKQPTPSDVSAILAGMAARLDLAISEVPSLEELRPAIERAFDAARTAHWPPLQRIHGDYHLGQVLAVPERGWVLVDFEGEPLRAMAERSEPDVSLRDVAGMLRSFDYAAGSVALNGNGESTDEWARSARAGFIAGYSARSGDDVRQHPALLDAFEIDKALYEVVYEARSRPDWLAIPVAAIRRLAGHGVGETEAGG
jgi:predicted trehalose synthase